MPADYGHVVHRGAEGETTEWDDIHARLGNAPPRASPRAPPAPFAPRAEEEDEAREIAAAPSRSVATARVDALGADALEEMEDDDAFADDAFLETYRRERLAELKASASVPRFGGVRDIARDAFLSEVTDASSSHHVVVLMYRPGGHCVQSEALATAMDELAAKHPRTKFVKIPGRECVPGYPDKNLPTTLVYRDRDVVGSFVGVDGFGGPRFTPEGVRLALNEGSGARGKVCGGVADDDADCAGEDEEQSRRRYANEIVQRMIDAGRRDAATAAAIAAEARESRER